MDMEAFRERKYEKNSKKAVSESGREAVSSESIFERLSVQDKKRVLALFWFLIQKNEEAWERGRVLMDEKNVKHFERDVSALRDNVFYEELKALLEEWGSGSAKLKASFVWDNARAEYAVALLRRALGLI